MKIISIIIVVFLVLLIPRFLPANQPTKENKNLGLSNGKLSPCPDKPNCINSEYPKKINSYLPAFEFPEKQNEQIIGLSKTVLEKMGAHIISQNEYYLSATFTSALFRFVDDVELRVAPHSHQLHFRSASRMGYSDFGVNRQRIVQFLSLLKEKL